MSDDRVWLQHELTGGFFHCPADAERDWHDLGWRRADAPPMEINPVTVELIAAQTRRVAEKPGLTETTTIAQGGLSLG